MYYLSTRSSDQNPINRSVFGNIFQHIEQLTIKRIKYRSTDYLGLLPACVIQTNNVLSLF